MQKNFILISLLFFCFNITYAQKITISGHVYESGSRESLIGVNVYIPELKAGTTSNTFGFYSLTIPVGNYTLMYSFVGYKTDTLIIAGKSVEKDVMLTSDNQLAEVEISALRKERQSQDVRMSTINVPIQQIKSLPAFLGEKDVLKIIQLMPGVQKGHEGSSGIYVRGGGPDQNLVILDDAVVYNVNHLFGFFSLFNGDALKSVELVKGGFPARYGGRLSSVLEMNMKDGNKEKISGEAGIGVISSRLTLDGPIIKNKSSFLISGRRTYLDILTRPLMKKENGVVGYYFYDLNAKVNYDFGRTNKLYLSGYLGRDKFYMKMKDTYPENYESNSALFWQNATGTLRWNHLFNDKLFMNTSFITTHYNLTISSESKSTNENYFLKYVSSINDFSLKSDVSYYLSTSHTLRFGVQSTLHNFSPSALVYTDNSSGRTIKAKTLVALENGIYAEDNFRVGNYQINPGVRFSHFLIDGKNYSAIEPRMASSYSINDHSAIKASFASMNQYVHLLSNTGVGLPTDLWVPTTEKIKPQHSWQLAAGYSYDILAHNLSLSIEGYYKEMKNIIAYKEGASFISVGDFETSDEMRWQDNITAGKGKSYGLEVLLQRKTGKLSGWVGYTLSWTKHQFDEINNGKEFYAKYDRRHDVSVVAVYTLNKRITLSGVWVYGTGEAYTLPLATYSDLQDMVFKPIDMYQKITDYGGRNEFRMRAYHRLDLGMQVHTKGRWGVNTWEFGVYNAYSRKNPFFYYLDTEYNQNTQQSRSVLKQLSLFPLIPSVTYTVKF